MNRDTVRSLGVFLAVVLVLAGLVLGGVYFAKSRSANYIRLAQQPVATNNQGGSEQQNQPEPQPAPSDTQQNPQPDQPASTPTTPQPQPAPSQQTPAEIAPVSTSAEQVPATGPTDLFIVAGLVMAAVYSLISLRRTRLSIRRLLS